MNIYLRENQQEKESKMITITSRMVKWPTELETAHKKTYELIF